MEGEVGPEIAEWQAPLFICPPGAKQLSDANEAIPTFHTRTNLYTTFSLIAFHGPLHARTDIGCPQPPGMTRQRNGVELETLDLRGTGPLDKVGLSFRSGPGSGSKESDPEKVAFFVSAALAAVPSSINIPQAITKRILRWPHIHSLDEPAPSCNTQYFRQVPSPLNETATSRCRVFANSRDGKNATTSETGWRH
jgi:hypothetical protein